MSEKTLEFTGSFARYLEAFINEKRELGCRYVEEERLAHEFDRLSMGYDCGGGAVRRTGQRVCQMQTELAGYHTKKTYQFSKELWTLPAKP